MRGFIYISSVFLLVTPPQEEVIPSVPLGVKGCGCGLGSEWLDNDPHFWTDPPTWGICRPDLREKSEVGDYVFFILGADSPLPQMIYGYFRIKNEMTHIQAYNSPPLLNKRMGDKNPNGNIIVDANGDYNLFDRGRHRDNFQRIKKHYVVGDTEDREFLTKDKILRLAPDFPTILRTVFPTRGSTAIEAIHRSGKTMNAKQVNTLLDWLDG